MTLEEAIAEAMGKRRVLIGLDFDGTLAPLVDDPAESVPDPEAIEILADLAARPAVTVAIVSGRALNDLEARLGALPGAVLIGEHGNDTGQAVGKSETLRSARGAIARLVNELGPVTVEDKPRSVTIHTRGLTAEATERVATEMRRFAASNDIALLEGKQVFELTVATGTKGTALGDLATNHEAAIYIGDDTTDETVFEILGPDDVSIKVGDGPTAARFRVDDVPAVVGVLRQATQALS